MTTGFRKAALLAAAIALPASAQTPQTVPVPSAAQLPNQPADKPAPPAPAGQSQEEALRLIDLWLDSVQAYDRLPSLTAAVVQSDRIVWANGYGFADRAKKVRATPATLYSICSISKLFTSVALMREWEAGKVRLDEPVATYLPWAKLAPSSGDSVPITVRGILTHSAGLPREAVNAYWTGPDFPFPTETEIRAGIGRQSPLYPASRWFQYSNLGLTLAGDIAAATSGEAYGDYIRRHILTPLGLTDTRPLFPRELWGNRLAVGWGALKRDGTRDLVQPFDAKGVTPAAGFTSNVEDLGTFAIWQFRLLRDGAAPEVLKPSTLREMHRVHYTDPDWRVTWGLGFSVRRQGERTYVGHGGDCPGYHTSLQLRPDSETAVTAMATGAEGPGAYVAQIFQLLDKRQGFAFKGPAPAAVDLTPFTGIYSAQPWGAEFAILPWAGGLAMLDLPTTTPADALDFLKPKGGDLFRAIRASGSEMDEVRFTRDAAGRVTGIERFGNRSKRVRDLPAFRMR